MKNYISAVVGMLVMGFPAVKGQSSYDPTVYQTFEQVVQSMTPLRWYSFGTGSGSTISNTQQLANVFNPYGIAAQTVTHQEWQRYQPFNNTNFVFTANALNLTCAIPSGGGVWPGGFNSGQIWTKETFTPGKTGHNIYAFLVRLKVPNAAGSWAGSWLYTEQPGMADSSEVDNPEVFVMQNQNQYDWTGYDHGNGAGSDIYSIKSNPWTWHPGMDFSASYHDYELVWTPDATYKYVDGKLIEAQRFQWTAPGTAQLGVTLAVGSSDSSGLPGLIPTSANEFPVVNSIQYISIWAK